MTDTIRDAQPGLEAEERELCRDIQMKLPDELWMLDYTGRYRAGRFNEDFARTDDGRCYLFGVCEVPIGTDAAVARDVFTWGVWIEVSPEDHDRYLDAFQTEAVEGLEIFGHLANEVPGCERSIGCRARLVCHADRRPEVEMIEGDLSEDQKRGMSSERHLEIDIALFGDTEGDFEDEDVEDLPVRG